MPSKFSQKQNAKAHNQNIHKDTTASVIALSLNEPNSTHSQDKSLENAIEKAEEQKDTSNGEALGQHDSSANDSLDEHSRKVSEVVQPEATYVSESQNEPIENEAGNFEIDFESQ